MYRHSPSDIRKNESLLALKLRFLEKKKKQKAGSFYKIFLSEIDLKITHNDTV